MTKRVTVIVEGREYIVEVGELGDSPIRATVNQRTYQVEVPRDSGQPVTPPVYDSVPASHSKKTKTVKPVVTSSAITAPLPGDIVEVNVKPGDRVQPGDVICVLEAMKMKNSIRAAATGVIASVEIQSGQSVDYGEVLVNLE